MMNPVKKLFLILALVLLALAIPACAGWQVTDTSKNTAADVMVAVGKVINTADQALAKLYKVKAQEIQGSPGFKAAVQNGYACELGKDAAGNYTVKAAPSPAAVAPPPLPTLTGVEAGACYYAVQMWNYDQAIKGIKTARSALEVSAKNLDAISNLNRSNFVHRTKGTKITKEQWQALSATDRADYDQINAVQEVIVTSADSAIAIVQTLGTLKVPIPQQLTDAAGLLCTLVKALSPQPSLCK